MAKPELNRVSRELLVSGYSMTSFDELGLELDQSEVDRFCLLVEASAGSAAALEAVKHIEKRDMTIVQDPVCMELGALLLAPVAETLFADVEGARENWTLFGVNRYSAGAKFGKHVDSVGSTVLIMTAKGERVLDIYEKIQDDTQPDGYAFGTLLDSFTLGLGSIMLLDRDADPGHAVRVALSDSISLVADVPGVLRPQELI